MVTLASQHDATVPLGQRSRAIRASRVGWAIGLTALVVLAPIVGPRTAQPASRYALTAAIVDHGTIDIGRYEPVLGLDHAIYDGKWRSDKGPGQPFLAAPAYAIARALGANPLDANTSPRADLVLWWLTFCTATVPFALLLVITYRYASRRNPTTAAVASGAVLLGSIALPHAVNLYAHALSALLGFSAYVILRPPSSALLPEPSPSLGAPLSAPTAKGVGVTAVSSWRVLVSGMLAGFAVVVEYHLAIVAIVLGLVVLVRCRRKFAWFMIGAMPAVATLGWYQWRAFGAVWRTPFAYYAGEIAGTTEGGYRLPTVAGIRWLFAGDRSLTVTGPIVVVAIVCVIAQVVGRVATRTDRTDAMIAFAVAAGYIVLTAGWSGTLLLEEPGPRYMIPALPFLVAPLAQSWHRVRGLARPAALWGVAIMAAATWTPNLVSAQDSVVVIYLRRVLHGEFLPTIWSLALGPLGVFAYAASVLLALRWLWSTMRLRPRG